MNLQDRFLMAGVMGWPVMHSRSPLMHNHWFAQEKLKGVYVPLAIQPDKLEAALRGLHALGFFWLQPYHPPQAKSAADC